MKQNQFKPFDQVLVKDDLTNNIWVCELFSHVSKVGLYVGTGGCSYDECIPYNEETKHLIGTSLLYQKPEPKVWKVIDDETTLMTHKELLYYIENVKEFNKIVNNFRIIYIGDNN